MMRRIAILLAFSVACGFLWTCWSSACVRAEETIRKKHVDFHRYVQPILKAHCLECHGGKRPRGGLQLTSRNTALLPADSGKKAIRPGDSSHSELMRRILATDKDVRMPPKGTPLTARQIRLLKNWIDRGAVWPEKAGRHWAYVKPIRPPLPAVRDRSWPQNSIDFFILSRLEEDNIAPSLRARKETLLRRVYLDLIGVPPTIAQIEAYVNDPRPNAYERVVDELLASPHYGERWARHWLDLARYADSNGFQRDGFRTVWPYRDWVVNAFNKDMPFNQFTIEQIAGDLLPGATVQQKIATGFNRCTTVNVEAGVDREQDRVNAVFDRVSTTATVWLGTTMVCAQCHEHKYDPFKQKDYYGLFAYFNSTESETVKGNGASRQFIGPKVSLPLDARTAQEQALLQQRQAGLQNELTKLLREYEPGQQEWEQKVLADKKGLRKLPKNIRKILSLKSAKRKANQKKLLANYFTNQQPYIKRVRLNLLAVSRKLKKLASATSLVMLEMEKPRPTHIFKRGNFLDKLERVNPGVPAALHQLPENSPPNRLALANWLVDENNPLVARVTVNRWWAEFFGHGIVSTIEDFGSQCDPPTHPDLLDWLAAEFVRSGWSMKHIHRLIVTSATYRQSSRLTTELLQRDPKNRLYTRGPRLRLNAEMIRDNALAVSGLLENKLGGPPVYPPQPKNIWTVIGVVDNTYRTSAGPDRYRRGLYTIWRRSSPYPSFVAFDAPDRSSCVVKRPRTNTPLQALTLMNDPVYVEAAIAFGRRMCTAPGAKTDRERIAQGIRLALTRQAGDREVEILHRILMRARKRYAANSNDARKLLQPFPQYSAENAAETAAWFQVATVILNLDEAITKN